MKIAITGSTGFIGKSLVNFLSKNHEIIAFGRKESPFNEDICYEFWDITQPLTKKIPCDIFIHAASDVSYEKSFREMRKTNVDSGSNILAALESSGCQHFIYISSSSVYMGISGTITESTCIDARNLRNSYALSKYLAEQFFLEHLPKHIRYTVLRPRAVYGVGDTTLLPKVLQYQVFGRLLLLGGGRFLTSITHIDNFCHALETILGSQDAHKNYEIYHISDSTPIAYAELYGKISESYGMRGFFRIPLFLIWMLLVFNPNKISYLLDTFGYEKVLDISKIKKLGYNPQRTIKSYLS